jgi:hypothetical protein
MVSETLKLHNPNIRFRLAGELLCLLVPHALIHTLCFFSQITLRDWHLCIACACREPIVAPGQARPRLSLSALVLKGYRDIANSSITDPSFAPPPNTTTRPRLIPRAVRAGTLRHCRHRTSTTRLGSATCFCCVSKDSLAPAGKLLTSDRSGLEFRRHCDETRRDDIITNKQQLLPSYFRR